VTIVLTIFDSFVNKITMVRLFVYFLINLETVDEYIVAFKADNDRIFK
jgi:hypothetical protein